MLNFIAFNKNYEPLFDPSQTNFVAITSSAKENGSNVPHERLFAEITVKEAGLMYIYLSNDNVALGGDPVDVFFDDFKVEHIKSPVVQMDDYYPFGLTFNSYKRENSVENMYQYNGKERQDELNLNWLDFGARMHQPELGRFFTVDPRSEAYNFQTPYAYAANNPVKFIEVNGEGPGDPIKNLNDAAKAVRSSINQMVSKSVKNNVEYSAMITASHLPNYEVGKGMTSVDKVFNFENERTDNSINNVGFDRKVNGAEQGKVHTHTEDGMAPSPGDVLNLLENKDSSKQGFFSLVATESKFFALVIEDPEKATKFLESNRYSLADDAANMVLELHHDKGMSESGAQKEAIFQLLKNSGIGFYEAYNSENPEFNKVKSQQR